MINQEAFPWCQQCNDSNPFTTLLNRTPLAQQQHEEITKEYMKESDEHINIIEARNGFKGFHYTRRNDELGNPEAKSSFAPPKNVTKATLPFSKNIPKTTTPNTSNWISLDVDLGSVLTKVNVPTPIFELAKLEPQIGQVRKILNLDREPKIVL